MTQSTRSQAGDSLARRENELEDGWEQLLHILDKVPFVGGLKRDVARVGRLVTGRRLGRLVAVGSPGAGRSQLANAMLGIPVLRTDVEAAAWTLADADGRRIQWLEIDAEPGASARARGVFATAEAVPDILLLVVTPAEVEAGLGAILEPFAGVLGVAQERAEEEGLPAPVAFAVLTQADALPPETAAPPFPEDKQQRIALVLQRFDRQIRDAALPVSQPMAVATFGSADQRLGLAPWGVEPLVERIAQSVPEDAQVETARALNAPVARRQVANALIQSCSTLSITVALAPVPFSDIVLIAPIQGMMVTTLAYLSGRAWDGRTATEWMASVGVVGGMGYGFRTVARQLVKFVPGAGSVVAAGIAGAGTLALGRSALRYYLPPLLRE